MISKSYILDNLVTMEKLYNKSKGAKKGLFYSKLAILELCGWIEESMDDIIQRCSIRKLKIADNRKYIKNEVIKRTFGFEYNNNFRNMLIKLIGIINVERLEKKLDPIKFQLLVSNLNTLKEIRNSEAHTHLKGITKRLDAPSVTKNRFSYLFEGLKDIDSKLRNLTI
jgi:hypothetical protein